MKFLGGVIVLLGLSILGFAGMAHLELRAAATSEKPPAADSMPLTKIICPELFDAGNAAVKPADLAKMAFNRVTMLGGGALLLATLGGLMFVISSTISKNQSPPP